MTPAAIAKARTYSDRKLRGLKDLVRGAVPPDAVVVACGSFARREACAASDLDYFVIRLGGEAEGEAEPGWVEPLAAALKEVVPIEPARGGPFTAVERLSDMVRNMGGQEDTNQRLTRRMLFLLEGEPLSERAGFRFARRALLDRYIASRVGDGMLPLFLLNDLIRYYRTIAVDYEYKTGEADKPWGLRNLKLVFSRKLLYASGLFALGAVRDGNAAAKIERLEALLDLTPLDRMAEICGAGAVRPILDSYDHFLDRLAKPGVRRHLEQLTRRERDDPVFRDLKDAGYGFTRELAGLFETTFDHDHPIRRAIVF
jgi:hypothetical protein